MKRLAALLSAVALAACAVTPAGPPQDPRPRVVVPGPASDPAHRHGWGMRFLYIEGHPYPGPNGEQHI